MKKTILIAAVMFFAFSVAASAQALYQVGSTPVTTVASCGTAELTGPINILQAVGSLPTITGTITISYGVPITNITGLTITANAAVNPALVANISLATDLSAGRLVLAVTPGGVNITSIIVTGVRVNIAGNPGLTSLTAQLTATGNSFVGGQTSVVVISSIASAISAINTGTPSTAINNISSVNGLPLPGTVTVNVVEGFLNAFVLNEMIGVTFSAVPAGISLTVPTAITDAQTTGFVLTDATGVALAAPQVFTSASVNLTAYYKVVAIGPAADTIQETLQIPVAVALTATATFPLPQGSVTASADVYPKWSGIGAPGTVFPQYFGTTCQKGPSTILTIVTATTNLLMPYATTLAGYDTGIAIANTTTDPFTPTTAKQDGALTFWFFPAGGTPFSITPTANGGLTGGVLKSGSEYVYLLSTLLADAGKPTAFSGYIFVICNFTNGHGQYFISNFDSFTNGALMLVTPVLAAPVGRATPEGLNN